jgi:hypothetical protein
MSDTLVCSIELSKTKGISLTVRNAAEKLTQTIVMNGTQIVTLIKHDDSADSSSITQAKDSILSQVASSSDTSTVMQNATSFHVKCKSFDVNAESVSVRSSKQTNHESGDAYTIVSQAGLSAKAAASLQMNAGTTLQLASDGSMALQAQTDLSATAQSTSVTGKGQATLEGAVNLELLGAQIAMRGDAQVTIGAPITKVGQNITTIEGQLVEIKGALVKLG